MSIYIYFQSKLTQFISISMHANSILKTRLGKDIREAWNIRSSNFLIVVRDRVICFIHIFLEK